MSNIIDIKNLHKEFKEEAEKNKFLEVQNKTIIELNNKISKQEEEIKHLQLLLTNTTQIIGENRIERIIKTPEEALIDGQIEILQSRSLGQELSLEEVKKLDLLLKNKILIKKDNAGNTLEGRSKQLPYSNSQLLELAKK